jgi:GDPmannose 4,6-dehydratase
MWLMLQQDVPDDFVIATGETHTVQEFCEIAFSRVGLDWRKHVVIDPRYVRPAEVDLLIGDPSKARKKLGWKPEVSFKELVHRMVDADMKAIEEEIRFGWHQPAKATDVKLDRTGTGSARRKNIKKR